MACMLMQREGHHMLGQVWAMIIPVIKIKMMPRVLSSICICRYNYNYVQVHGTLFKNLRKIGKLIFNSMQKIMSVITFHYNFLKN